MNDQKHILAIDGEYITGINFESSGKANVTTGARDMAIQYAASELPEIMAAIGGKNIESEAV